MGRVRACALGLMAFAVAAFVTPFADAQGDTPSPPARWAHPALWRIVSGTATVYLFGSVHIIPGNLAWADGDIDAAMRAADVFYFEASLDPSALLDVSNVMRTKGLLPKSRTLRSLLSRSGLANYNAIMAQLGLPPQQLDRFRPWLALLILGMRHSSDRAVTAPGSVDPTVMSYAQSHGRTLRYFETAKQQMAIFGDMDEETEVAVFEASLAQYNERADRTASLIDAWVKGDSETLADMLNTSFVSVPAARRAIVDDRNRDFATQIEGLLREPGHTYFVTVGAGHYGGRAGVISLLCIDNVAVVRMGRDGAPPTPACGQTRGSISR